MPAQLLGHQLQLPAIGEQGHQGRSGGGGAVIGHQVGNCGVVLVADPAHHRHGCRGDAAGQDLPVEHAEILAAAPAAGQHDRLQAKGAGGGPHPLERRADLRFHPALNGNGHEQDGGGRPALPGRAQHVGQGGAGHAGEQGDATGLRRQGALALRLQQTLRFQQLADPFEPPQHTAETRAQIEHLHGQAGPGRPEIELAHNQYAVAVARLKAEPGHLGGPHHRRHRGRVVHQVHPEVTLLQLGPAYGGLQQEARCEAALQQAGHRSIEAADAVAGELQGAGLGRIQGFAAEL